VLTDQFPSNRRRIIARVGSRSNVFTESIRLYRVYTSQYYFVISSFLASLAFTPSPAISRHAQSCIQDVKGVRLDINTLCNMKIKIAKTRTCEVIYVFRNVLCGRHLLSSESAVTDSKTLHSLSNYVDYQTTECHKRERTVQYSTSYKYLCEVLTTVIWKIKKVKLSL
jgi:hypothetical protein